MRSSALSTLIFLGALTSVQLAMLWLPTAFAIRRRQQQGVRTGTTATLLPFIVEVILAAALAWIDHRSWLRDHEGYVTVIALAVGGIGGFVTYHVLGMLRTRGNRDP
jgi:ABC-type spermidine/putrescine transport system permease subunit II